jgi:pentatricopeptide repeat protein
MLSVFISCPSTLPTIPNAVAFPETKMKKTAASPQHLTQQFKAFCSWSTASLPSMLTHSAFQLPGTDPVGICRAKPHRRGRMRMCTTDRPSSPSAESASLPPSSVPASTYETKRKKARNSWSERRQAAEHTVAAGGPKLTPAFNDWLGALRSEGGSLRDARPVLKRMAESGALYDDITYTHLIAMCGRGRDSVAASLLIGKMRKEGFNVSVVTYATFLATCARSNDVIRAKEAWRQMVNEDMSPNARACGAFIDCLSRAGLVDDARRILKQYPVGDTLISRTSLVSGLARAGLVDDALDSLQEMIDHGFSPNVLAYTAITHALGKAKRASDAISLLNDAVNRRVETDALLYESVICACAAVGDIESAFQVLRSMRSCRMDLTDRGFEGLIYACGSSGQFHRAYIVFRAAEAADKATGRVLSAIASALLQVGWMGEKTAHVLGKMLAFSDGKTDPQLTRLGVNPERFRRKIASIKRIQAVCENSNCVPREQL